MVKDSNFVKFFKKHSSLFKEYAVNIPIFDKNYEFNIISITDDYLKLQYRSKFSSIFYSKNHSLEYSIKNIIDDDGMYSVPSDYALAQRAITRRNLRGTSFQVLINGFEEKLLISNISREYISVEIKIKVEDIGYSGNILANIIGDELYSFKFEVEKKLRDIEEEKIKKAELRKQEQKKRELRNTVYSKEDLISRAISKKFLLKRNSFIIDVNNKEYPFNIEGIGDFAVKLSLSFDLNDIFYSYSRTVEQNIKNMFFEILGKSFFDVDEFILNVNENKSKFTFQSFDILIGEKYSRFNLLIDDNKVKLLKFVNYDEIMEKFNKHENCLETILKKHIENFKPMVGSFEYHYEFVVPKKSKKKYSHPKKSQKENPESVRQKLAKKQEARKKYEKNHSLKSNNRSRDIGKILR